MGYDKENARKEDCMRPLYDCALFQGLPEADLHAALRFFVRVSMTDIDGREMLLS